ncbi:MAG: hypothetical protein QXG00_00305 [Candidatus Woesearchaeota archaeon]
MKSENLLKKNKKGISMFTVSLIIIIVGLAVMLLLLNKCTTNLNSYKNREVCKTSVYTQAVTKFKLGPLKVDSPFTIECNTMNVKFYNTKVEVNGDKVSFYYRGAQIRSFSSLTDEHVNAFLAEELKRCWYQFYEGKLEILNDQYYDLGKNEKLCFICDQISFNKDVSQNSFSGFYNYLKENKMANSDITYYEYITNKYPGSDDTICFFYSNNPSCFENYMDSNYLNIPASDPVAISFFVVQPSIGLLWDEIVNNRAKHPSMAQYRNIEFDKMQTYVIYFVREGAEKHLSSYFAYIIPTSELKNQCSKLI